MTNFRVQLAHSLPSMWWRWHEVVGIWERLLAACRGGSHRHVPREQVMGRHNTTKRQHLLFASTHRKAVVCSCNQWASPSGKQQNVIRHPNLNTGGNFLSLSLSRYQWFQSTCSLVSLTPFSMMISVIDWACFYNLLFFFSWVSACRNVWMMMTSIILSIWWTARFLWQDDTQVLMRLLPCWNLH